MARAYLLYSQAAALAPTKNAYWLKSQAVRTRAALQSKISISDSDSSLDVPVENEVSAITSLDYREARRPGPPPELAAEPGRKNLNLKAPPRVLFEEVTKAFGLDVVFDGDYPQGGPPVAFHMDDADYREALRGLQAATSSFVAPITDRVLMVAKETQQKRNDVEPSVSVVIPIPQTVSVQEAQELARGVQQLMDIRRFAVDTARRLILLQGPVSKIRPAQRLFEDLLRYRPEVSVNLQFIEVTHSDLTDLGLLLPSSSPLVPLTTILHSVPSIPSGLSYLLQLGGGASIFGIAISNSQIFAQFNKSNSKTLLETNIRSLDNMPATFHVGDRYPSSPAVISDRLPPASARSIPRLRPSTLKISAFPSK